MMHFYQTPRRTTSRAGDRGKMLQAHRELGCGGHLLPGLRLPRESGPGAHAAPVWDRI